MFFWLALLTFLSTLLIYSFYPRNDAITVIDKPEANVAVTDLLTQHLAALDAAEVLSVDGSTRQKAYVKWITDDGWSADDVNAPYKVTNEKFEGFLPPGFIFNPTDNSGEIRSPITEIYCINREGAPTNECGVTSGGGSTTDFLITYIDEVPLRFDRYIEGLSHRSLGEKMFLTEYINDNRNSNRAFGGYSLKTNCGIVRGSLDEEDDENDFADTIPDTIVDFDPNGTFVLDNTRYYTVRIPAAMARVSLRPGQLACITRLSVTYEPDENNNLRIVYPNNSSD